MPTPAVEGLNIPVDGLVIPGPPHIPPRVSTERVNGEVVKQMTGTGVMYGLFPAPGVTCTVMEAEKGE